MEGGKTGDVHDDLGGQRDGLLVERPDCEGLTISRVSLTLMLQYQCRTLSYVEEMGKLQCETAHLAVLSGRLEKEAGSEAGRIRLTGCSEYAQVNCSSPAISPWVLELVSTTLPSPFN